MNLSVKYEDPSAIGVRPVTLVGPAGEAPGVLERLNAPLPSEAGHQGRERGTGMAGEWVFGFPADALALPDLQDFPWAQGARAIYVLLGEALRPGSVTISGSVAARVAYAEHAQVRSHTIVVTYDPPYPLSFTATFDNVRVRAVRAAFSGWPK